MEISSLEIQNEKAVLLIKGSAVIDTVSHIHQLFLKAFDSGKPVTIDVSQSSECDLTFIQLICSLCYSIIQEKRLLEINKINLPDHFFKSIKYLGFNCRCKCFKSDSLKCIFSIDSSCSESNVT